MRTVVITGAAGGIGTALAHAFIRAGDRVALLELDESRLETLRSRLPADRVLGLTCDVTDPSSCTAAIDAVTTAWGGVDVLINNAGISHRSRFEDTDTDVLRKVMDVNLFGSIHCTRAALTSLIARRGQVVVLSSVAGFAPLVGRTGYCASKHALHGFFGALRTEVRPDGVNVLLVCPAFTDTGLAQRALKGDGSQIGSDATRSVAGRQLQPAEVADAILQGLDRRRELMLLPAVSRASFWLSRLVPRVYERMMLRSQRAEMGP
jgi:NAD(P)-dependent dehydrogenase (short-subunit alcohol dehydrogenase family)